MNYPNNEDTTELCCRCHSVVWLAMNYIFFIFNTVHKKIKSMFRKSKQLPHERTKTVCTVFWFPEEKLFHSKPTGELPTINRLEEGIFLLSCSLRMCIINIIHVKKKKERKKRTHFLKQEMQISDLVSQRLQFSGDHVLMFFAVVDRCEVALN